MSAIYSLIAYGEGASTELAERCRQIRSVAERSRQFDGPYR